MACLYELHNLHDCAIELLNVHREKLSEMIEVDSAIELLVRKSLMAIDELGLKKLVLAGGVASNRTLRGELLSGVEKRGGSIHFPSPILCTDNGAMVARTARFHNNINQSPR